MSPEKQLKFWHLKNKRHFWKLMWFWLFNPNSQLCLNVSQLSLCRDTCFCFPSTSGHSPLPKSLSHYSSTPKMSEPKSAPEAIPHLPLEAWRSGRERFLEGRLFILLLEILNIDDSSHILSTYSVLNPGLSSKYSMPFNSSLQSYELVSLPPSYKQGKWHIESIRNLSNFT